MKGMNLCMQRKLMDDKRLNIDFRERDEILRVTRGIAHGPSLSEGGIKRSGAGLPDSGRGPARRSAAVVLYLSCSSQGGDVHDPGVPVGDVGMAAWDADDLFGEVGRPPEVSVGELSAQEADDFFGLG